MEETYSHFNGLEFLLVHKPQLWDEIQDIISTVDESPSDRNESNGAFRRLLVERGWRAVISDADASSSYNGSPINVVKERIALRVHLEPERIDMLDLFTRHLASYVGDQIDVGIEITPMKSLQLQMSSGAAGGDGKSRNVIRRTQAVPAAPLVLVGIEE